MKITHKHIADIATLVRKIAEDLESVGPEDWDDLPDACQGTVNNVEHDLMKYYHVQQSKQ